MTRLTLCRLRRRRRQTEIARSGCLQAQLDRLAATGGGRLLLDGIVELAETLCVPPHVAIEGFGSASGFRASARFMGREMLVRDASDTPATRVEWRNFAVDGRGTAEVGIRFTAGAGITLTGLHVHDHAETNVESDGVQNSAWTGLYCDRAGRTNLVVANTTRNLTIVQGNLRGAHEANLQVGERANLPGHGRLGAVPVDKLVLLGGVLEECGARSILIDEANEVRFHDIAIGAHRATIAAVELGERASLCRLSGVQLSGGRIEVPAIVTRGHRNTIEECTLTAFAGPVAIAAHGVTAVRTLHRGGTPGAVANLTGRPERVGTSPW